MPDPLSITTGVLSLLKVTWTVSTELKKFHDGVTTVNQTMGSLLQDVQGLAAVLESMRETFERITAEYGTGHVSSHWDHLARSLEDGRQALDQFNEQMKAVNKTTKFLDGPRKQLRLNMSEDKITGFRIHVQSYRDCLQLSLQTVILWNQVSQQKSTEQVLPNLSDLHQDVRRIALDLNEKIESLQRTVHRGPSDEVQITAMHNLRDCVRSAASIVSSASTVIASVKGDEVEVPASDFGDCFPVEHYSPAIQRWMATKTISECDEVEQAAPLQSVSQLRVVSEEEADSDSDLEREMTEALFQSGRRKLTVGEHSGAERCFRNCLSRLPAVTSRSARQSATLVEVLTCLIDMFIEQRRWSDAQDMILRRIAAEERTSSKGEVLEDVLALAKVVKQKGDVVEAELHARKALKGFRKLKHDVKVRTCLELLVDICNAGGKDDDREAYSTMLANLDNQVGNTVRRERAIAVASTTSNGDFSNAGETGAEATNLSPEANVADSVEEAREVPRTIAIGAVNVQPSEDQQSPGYVSYATRPWHTIWNMVAPVIGTSGALAHQQQDVRNTTSPSGPWKFLLPKNETLKAPVHDTGLPFTSGYNPVVGLPWESSTDGIQSHGSARDTVYPFAASLDDASSSKRFSFGSEDTEMFSVDKRATPLSSSYLYIDASTANGTSVKTGITMTSSSQNTLPEPEKTVRPIAVLGPQIVLIGDSSVEKSGLLRALPGAKARPLSTNDWTKGYDWVVSVDGTPVNVVVWYPPGDEIFDYLHVPIYADANCAILCFSIDNPRSLDRIKGAGSRLLFNSLPTHSCRVLLGCRADKREDPIVLEKLAKTEQHPVAYQEAEAVQKEIRAQRYFECCTHNDEYGNRITEAFEHAARVATLLKPFHGNEKREERAMWLKYLEPKGSGSDRVIDRKHPPHDRRQGSDSKLRPAPVPHLEVQIGSSAEYEDATDDAMIFTQPQKPGFVELVNRSEDQDVEGCSVEFSDKTATTTSTSVYTDASTSARASSATSISAPSRQAQPQVTNAEPEHATGGTSKSVDLTPLTSPPMLRVANVAKIPNDSFLRAKVQSPTVASLVESESKMHEPEQAIHKDHVPARKLVLAGDSWVGKSQLLGALPGAKRRLQPSALQSVAICWDWLASVDGESVNVTIWDTAGQETDDQERSQIYDGADCALLCFSINDPDSLDNIEEKWAPEAARSLPISASSILVGCQVDTRQIRLDLQRRLMGNSAVVELFSNVMQASVSPVKPEEAEAVQEKIGAQLYLECSARTSEGVTDLFEHATRLALTSEARQSTSKGQGHKKKKSMMRLFSRS